MQQLYHQISTLQQQNKIQQAIGLMLDYIARGTSPDHKFLAMLSSLYARNGQYYEAREHIQNALKLDNTIADIHYLAGNIELSLGEAETALSCFNNAKKCNYKDRYSLSLGLLKTYERLGKRDRAFKIASELLDDGHKDLTVLILYAICCTDPRKKDRAFTDIEQYLDNSSVPDSGMVDACFALGKYYDSKGDYKKSFSYYKKANDLCNFNFDRWSDNRSTEYLITTMTKSFMDVIARGKKVSSNITPVFIVGFPRSGTSLLEKMLDSHSNIYGAGELPYITDIMEDIRSRYFGKMPYPDCLTCLDKKDVNNYSKYYIKKVTPESHGNIKFVTDKTPMNYTNIGLIEILFPGAVIINCRRHPIDTCLSCYFQNFSSYQPHTYDLKDLASTYNNYLRIMEHWKSVSKLRILDVWYEDLIMDTEATITSVLEFTGLKFEKKCLRFYDSGKITKTASYDQVTKKIYKGSVERWRNYEDFIRNSDLMKLV